MNDGNAINFLYSAAVDRYIYLVQGELISAIGALYKNKNSKQKINKILTSQEEDRVMIANAWIDYVYK